MPSTAVKSAILLTLIQTCIAQGPVSFTFTDTHFFFDVSTFNFYAGLDQVYDSKLTARPGHKVSLYIFLNNVNRYNLQVFDGSDTSANTIPVMTSIPNDQLALTVPVPVKSSGQNMYIRVRADTSDSLNLPTTDFQAVATDFVQPAGCGDIVISSNINAQGANISLVAVPQTDCYYILHASDLTNNPYLWQSLHFNNQPDAKSVTVYKGLLQDPERVLISDQSSSIDAIDKYLMIKPTKTVQLSSIWDIGVLNAAISVDVYQHGTLMTNDYYQETYPYDYTSGPMQQLTILDREYTVAATIQVTFLKFRGSGSLSFTGYVYDKIVVPEIFYYPSQLNSPFNVSCDCTRIVLKYSTPDRNSEGGSGFYGFYDASDSIAHSTTQRPLSTPITQSTPTVTKATKTVIFSTLLFMLSIVGHVM